MYLVLSLLYLATLALSVTPRTLLKPSTPSLLPSTKSYSQTTSRTPSSSTASTSGSKAPKIVGQCLSFTSSFPSSATMSRSSTPSSSPSSSPTPLPSPVSSQTQQDMNTILQRRLGFITASATKVSQIASWVSTLGPNGSWPASEIDYTTGCSARPANWPASVHWSRILTMSAAWHGGLTGAGQYTRSPALTSAISSAMDFWFSRDFTIPGCLDQGGTTTCPCGTPGFWDTNWFSNVILVPNLVGESCLLFKSSLSQTQVNNCTSISARAYDKFYEGNGFLAGANILDVAKIGVDLALLTSNTTLITESYGRINAEIVIQPGVMIDGIKPDGSFGQHAGLLYNGNYGWVFSSDVLELQIDAAGTRYAADPVSQRAFETLIDGDQWMVYRNVKTDVLHWDFSSLSRFISFPVIDSQATSGLNLNLSEILQLGKLWGSSSMVQVYNNFVKPSNNANAGNLVGNRIFYNNDYMVQRGPGYVSTLKMYSTRTQNTECVNSQNPFGFHLADGTLYTYLRGNEYEDIAAAWDWNLIPGITVDYGATPLNCPQVQRKGRKSFVGGVSNGKTGVAAMKYLNPLTKAFSWQKAWFFLDDDTQYVMVANLTSHTNAPVYSVLDQRRHSGAIYVNNETFNAPGNQTFDGTVSSLWHGGVGYLFEPGSTRLSLSVGERTGAWSAIGISTQPPSTVDLFAGWIQHQNLTRSTAYAIFPGTTFDGFRKKSRSREVVLLQNDAHISAVLDARHSTVSAVFWDASGGTLPLGSVAFGSHGPAVITVSRNVALMLDLKKGTLTVSDPSQTLTSVVVEVAGMKEKPVTSTVNLPSGPGGLAGSSVTTKLS